MFKLLAMDKGNTPLIKQLTPAAATYAVGEVAAVAPATGYLTKVSGTNAPSYVVVEKGTKTTADTISVQPIYKDQEYLTTLAVDGALVPGTKVTIHTDSASVTSTTTSGVATVVEAMGTTSGSEVIVKFI